MSLDTCETTLTELVPYFILNKQADTHANGSFKAYCLFIDIVGFTKLTTKLMSQGTVGAEQLSDTLNKLFGPIVDRIYERQGFIPYFAGDAFLAFFEADNNKEHLHKCLALTADIQAYFNNTDDQDIANIAIKVGMSYGEVNWGICGTRKEDKTFYFRGEAIECATKAQQLAEGGEVIMQASLVPEDQRWVSLIEDGQYAKLQDFPLRNEYQEPQQAPNSDVKSNQTASEYLPPNVIGYNLKGEFRDVTSVFISFIGVESHEAAAEFFTKVRSLTSSFSGYFKEIDFSDKGGVLVVLFGAPVSFENNVERALELSLALKDEQASGAFQDNLEFKIGISTGMCFTGMLGGKYKKQYVALGTHVNLAARLMSYSNWGQIAVTKEVALDEGFVFHRKGEVHYKGIANAISTYTLEGRSNVANRFSGHFIGRDEEENSILEFLTTHTIEENKPTFIKIYGEAGIGKSRLVHEIELKVSNLENIRWHTCQADQILRKPFNPIIFFLKDYFNQKPKHTRALNQRNFESRLQYFINEFESDADQTSAQELLRFKPVYNALLGFDTRNTLWEELDARARFNSIIEAVVFIFKKISVKEKLIVEFEDLHWFDESTMAFLKKLIEEVDNSPIAIICTSRYHDDGTKPVIINSEFLVEEGFVVKEVDLNQLSTNAIKLYTEDKLEGKASDSFWKFLSRTTNGNPFYLEQILAYLVESDLLEQEEGIWSIKDEDISVSSSINSILMARIDRLSEQVKETVKTAAVIGREFEVPVLNEVMKSNFIFEGRSNNAILNEQIKAAEKGQIWSAINELKYIFKHSLLREAVYNMQLKSNLRDLHLLIGEAIEQLYGDHLAPRFVDLAFHFEEGQKHSKAIFYMRKAADTARKNFQNKQALMFYDKVKAYLDKEREAEEYAKILLRESEILELIGKWTEGLIILREANELAESTKNPILLGRTKNQLGKLLILKGNYPEAKYVLESAIKIFSDFNDEIGLFKAQGNLGDLFFRQAEYDNATAYFEKSIELAKDFKDTFTVTQIVSNLGLTYMNQSRYEEAIKCQKEQLVLCENRGDRNGMAILNTNIGIVYSELNRHEEAFPYYEIGYELSHELGNKQMEAIAIGCLGHIYHQRGNYNKALELYLTDHKLCKELGDKRGLAIINGLIAELLISIGDFDKAKEHLASQLSYSLELQYQKGITKAYSTIGQIHFYRNQFDKAIENFEKSIELADKIKYFPSKEEACIWKIDVLLATDKHRDIKECIQDLESYEELENKNALLIRKAELQFKNKQISQATSSIRNLIPYLKHPKNLARAHWSLAKIEESYRSEALSKLNELYAQMPDYEIKIKIDDLA